MKLESQVKEAITRDALEKKKLEERKAGLDAVTEIYGDLGKLIVMTLNAHRERRSANERPGDSINLDEDVMVDNADNDPYYQDMLAKQHTLALAVTKKMENLVASMQANKGQVHSYLISCNFSYYAPE